MGGSVVRKTLDVSEIKGRLYQKRSPYCGVPALPVHIDYEHPNAAMRVTREGDTFTQEWGEGLVTERKGYALNGQELLEVFASIRVAHEAGAFLESCGPFRDRGLDAQTIAWSEFQQWQEFMYRLRQGVLNKRPCTFRISELDEAIYDPQPVMPHFVGGKRIRAMQFHPKTALEYLGTIVYLDYLRGVDLKLCRLPTCKKLFEQKSDREQFYCCPPHGRQHSKSLERQALKLGGDHGKA